MILNSDDEQLKLCNEIQLIIGKYHDLDVFAALSNMLLISMEQRLYSKTKMKKWLDLLKKKIDEKNG